MFCVVLHSYTIIRVISFFPHNIFSVISIFLFFLFCIVLLYLIITLYLCYTFLFRFTLFNLRIIIVCMFVSCLHRESCCTYRVEILIPTTNKWINKMKNDTKSIDFRKLVIWRNHRVGLVAISVRETNFGISSGS